MRYRRNNIKGPKANMTTSVPYATARIIHNIAKRRRVTTSFAICQLIELGIDALATGADPSAAGRTSLFSRDYKVVPPGSGARRKGISPMLTELVGYDPDWHPPHPEATDDPNTE